MNIFSKWKAYDAGLVTPPSVVQYDQEGDEHLIWVWTGSDIIQVSRKSYDETTVIEEVMALSVVTTESYEIECEDGETLNMEIPV